MADALEAKAAQHRAGFGVEAQGLHRQPLQGAGVAAAIAGQTPGEAEGRAHADARGQAVAGQAGRKRLGQGRLAPVQGRAAGDVEVNAVGRRQGKGRGEAAADLQDGVQERGVGGGIGLHRGEFGHAGAGGGQRQTEGQAEVFGALVHRLEAQGVAAAGDQGEGRGGRARPAQHPLGRKPRQPQMQPAAAQSRLR